MDYCNIYVNECSAEGQMADDYAVEHAVKRMLDCMAVVDGCDANVVIVRKFYSSKFYTAKLTQNVTVETLHNKDLKKKIKLAFRSASCWDRAPLTDIRSKYFYAGRDVTNTSMSESYEQKSSMLINYGKSRLQEPIVVIEKNGVKPVSVDSFLDPTHLLNFVLMKKWRKRQYDLSSTISPRDEESILSDKTLFEITRYQPLNGRKIYRRIGTKEVCYIDSKHSGGSAHIEVFNEETKEMICKLNINEDSIYRQLTKNEKGRKFPF